MYAKLSVNFDTNQTVTYFLMVIREEKRAKYAVAFQQIKIIGHFLLLPDKQLGKKVAKMLQK